MHVEFYAVYDTVGRKSHGRDLPGTVRTVLVTSDRGLTMTPPVDPFEQDARKSKKTPPPQDSFMLFDSIYCSRVLPC
jgi:hypothetical protein